MANEGTTKPTYSNEELMANCQRERRLLVDECERLEAELLRVRGLLQRQWISVEERLPEVGEMVFCFVVRRKKMNPQSWMDMSFRERNGWNLEDQGDGDPDVTHWMPLPDTPNFPQPSSLVSQGAESADIGRLDAADESEKLDALVAEHANDCKKCDGTGFEHILRTTAACRWCNGAGKVESSLSSPPPTKDDSSAPTSPEIPSTQHRAGLEIGQRGKFGKS